MVTDHGDHDNCDNHGGYGDPDALMILLALMILMTVMILMS